MEKERREYEAARSALADLKADAAAASAQSLELGERAAGLARDLEAERRLSCGLRRGLADKERQLAVVLAEVERLAGRSLAEAGDAAASDPTTAAAGELDAAGVIDLRLVTFASLAQLVERNSQLLLVARGLAEEVDAGRRDAEARIADARAAEAAETERRVEELTATCTALAAEAQACKRAAEAALRNRGTSSVSSLGPEAAAELQAANERVTSLEASLEQARADAASSAALLQEQIETARAAESAARNEVASARAERQLQLSAAEGLRQQLEDALERGERLTAQLAEQRSTGHRLEGQIMEVRWHVQHTASLGWALGRSHASGGLNPLRPPSLPTAPPPPSPPPPMLSLLLIPSAASCNCGQFH
jgi:hypothetical protein